MEKILKIVIILASSGFFMTCSSLNVWETKEKITPNSYKSYSKYSTQNVGLLRRLLFLPVHFQTLKGGELFFEKNRSWLDHTDTELGYSSDELEGYRISELVVDYLSNWKGYEVINLNLYPFNSNHNFSIDQNNKRYVKDLFNWSEKADNYEKPTENIIKIIKELGGKYNVDGVLIVGGVRKLFSDWKNYSVILSAGLLMPIMHFDTCYSFQTYIFEVNTGKIVWTSRASIDCGLNPSIDSILWPLNNLEQAIPKVMTR